MPNRIFQLCLNWTKIWSSEKKKSGFSKGNQRNERNWQWKTARRKENTTNIKNNSNIQLQKKERRHIWRDIFKNDTCHWFSIRKLNTQFPNTLTHTPFFTYWQNNIPYTSPLVLFLLLLLILVFCGVEPPFFPWWCGCCCLHWFHCYAVNHSYTLLLFPVCQPFIVK